MTFNKTTNALVTTGSIATETVAATTFSMDLAGGGNFFLGGGAADRTILISDTANVNRTTTLTFPDTTATYTFPEATGTLAVITAANSWADGVRQTFNPNGTNAGLNVGSHVGDPSAPSNGDLWYDSAANELTARINGVSVALGGGGIDPIPFSAIASPADCADDDMDAVVVPTATSGTPHAYNDSGGAWNTTTGEFTAPATGQYHFDVSAEPSALVGGESVIVGIAVNGSRYIDLVKLSSGSKESGGCTLRLTSGQVVTFLVRTEGGSSSGTTSTYIVHSGFRVK